MKANKNPCTWILRGLNKKQTRFLNCPIMTLSDSSPRTGLFGSSVSMERKKSKIPWSKVHTPWRIHGTKGSPLPIYEWLIFCGILVGQIQIWRICKPRLFQFLRLLLLFHHTKVHTSNIFQRNKSNQWFVSSFFAGVCDACSTQSSHTTGGLSSCEDLIYWRRYSNEPHPKKTWTWTSQTRKTSIWGQIEKNTKKTVGYGKTTLKPPLGLLPHNHHLKSITKQYHGSMLFDIPTNWLVHRYPYNYNGSGIIPI